MLEPGVRCGTCLHWSPPTEREDFLNVYKGDDVDRLFGKCKAVPMADSYEEAPTPIPLAVAKDGSDYTANLFTRAEFGCVLWEADKQ